MAHIEFFGLGEMGYPMAGHLARAGHAVLPHDPDTRRLAQWEAAHGGPRPAAADILITSVTDTAALGRLIDAAEGIATRLRPGMLWIDHTTTSPAFARDCAALAAARGAAFVDCAMSGGAAGAQAGELALFAGGANADAVRASELTRPYCRHFFHLGAAGAGQAAKLAHQLAIAGTVLGLDAALAYGGAQGLGRAQLLAALEAGTAGSAQLAQHREKLGAPQFDFSTGFAWLAKDLAALPADSPLLPMLLRGWLQTPNPTPPGTGAQ